eukprot:Partr_v1_DN28799_c0_g1_i1_m63380 putative calcium exchanger
MKLLWTLLLLVASLFCLFVDSSASPSLLVAVDGGDSELVKESFECRTPPQSLSPAEKCAFIRRNCSGDEDSPGAIDYLDFYYCTMEDAEPWALILLILNLVFLFVFLGTAASDYFCPNLSTLSDRLQLPPDVTGATFLAMGNCVADLVSSLVAIHSAGSVAMAIGELIGAGLFVGGVVAAAIALSARFPSAPDTKHVSLKREVFMRDAGFFFISVVVMGAILADGKLTWWEGLISLSVYFAYAGSIVYRYVKQKQSPFDSGLAEDGDIYARRLSSTSSQLEESVLIPYQPASRKSSRVSVVSRSSKHSSVERLVEEKLNTNVRSSLNSALQFWDAKNKLDEEADQGLPIDIRDMPVTDRADPRRNTIKGAVSFCPICSRIPEPDAVSNRAVRAICILNRHFFPIFWTWPNQGVAGRIISIFNFPAVIALSGTVPVVASQDVDELTAAEEVVSIAYHRESAGSCSDSCMSDFDERDRCTCCGRLRKPSEIEGELNPLLEKSFTSAETNGLEHDEIEWHYRYILIVQMLLSPSIVFFALGFSPRNFGTVDMPFLGWMLALIIGAGMSAIVSALTHPYLYANRRDRASYPFRHPLFCFYGFVMGLFWIYLVANEVVGVLRALGTILSISPAIMGVTVLAFGNSISDLISNVTMARMGFPTMSISASFSGPLITILLTLGISGVITTSDAPLIIPVNTNLIITYFGLLGLVTIDIISIPLLGYKVGKKFGVSMLVYYCCVMAVTLICEMKEWTLPGMK